MLDLTSLWLSVFSDGICAKTDTSPQTLRNPPPPPSSARQQPLQTTSSCKYCISVEMALGSNPLGLCLCPPGTLACWGVQFFPLQNNKKSLNGKRDVVSLL